ncbi:unnamed protein product, partial [Ectocarpus sp. 8 AP-2014]
LRLLNPRTHAPCLAAHCSWIGLVSIAFDNLKKTRPGDGDNADMDESPPEGVGRDRLPPPRRHLALEPRHGAGVRRVQGLL